MLGRRLLARRDHGRAGALRRLPGERAGRGRRVGRTHARSTSRRWARCMPEAHARADGDPAHARGALPRHAGHGVHGRGGAPLHAPDAQREAARRRRRCGSRSTRSRRACSTARRRSRRSTPRALDALLHPTFEPDAEFDVLARGVDASPGAAKGEIVFTADEAVAAGGGGPRRRARAAVHRGRRRRRLLRRQGHPHERGRQGQPRRAGGARDGPARACPARPSSRSTWRRARCG